MRVGAVEHVFIEFSDDIDPESLAECRDAYDRIPNIRWKIVTVVLHRIDRVNSAALALLRHVQSRASACEFFVVNCGPGISKIFGHTPSAHGAVPEGKACVFDEEPRDEDLRDEKSRSLVRDRTIDNSQPLGTLRQFQFR